MRLSRCLVVALALGGCSSDGHELIVEARTDLTPGVEFVTVRVMLDDEVLEVVPAVIGQDFITPVRVAEVEDLSVGSYRLVVSAMDASGRAVVSRTVRIELRTNLGVSVTLSRSCEGVVCPMAGDAETRTTCAAGRCVDPACSSLAPELCAPGDCTADSQCTSSIACAVGLCIEGGCLFAADDSTCGPSETCSPTMGCVGGLDGGMDASMPDATPDALPDAVPDVATDIPVDARPTCETEVLLASSMPQRETGGFSGAFSSLVVVLTGDPGGAEIGFEDLLPSGHTGTRDFRAGDDDDFDAVVASLMSGSAPSMAVKAPVGGGGYGPVTLSMPVSGRLITMIRRDIESLTFTNPGARTDYDATVSWELWGCDP